MTDVSAMAGVRRLSETVPVLVVGPHESEADMVRAALEHEGLEVDVAFEVAPGAAESVSADIVVMTRLHWPAEVRSVARMAPGARIIVVSDEVTSAAIRRLLEAGADGIIVRQGWQAALGAVCRAVLSGYLCVPTSSREVVEPPALSLRERQVLALMAGGLTNAEIAEQLFLSESTVKSHAASAFRRLGVNSRREAVALVLGSSEALRRSVLMSHPVDRPIGRFMPRAGR